MAMACIVWLGCSSDDAASPTNGGAGTGGTGAAAGSGGVAGTAGASGVGGVAAAAGAGGVGGAAGGAGAGGDGWFDPAASIGMAFTYARQEAVKSFTGPWVAFVDATGIAPMAGAGYASYNWSFTFVAGESGGSSFKGISLAYPGWTAKTVDGMPMGAYLEESDFSTKVKIGFPDMVEKAGQAGLSPDSCVDPVAQTPISFIVTLRGSNNPSNPGWFWEFFCPGDAITYRFDAGTGEQVID